MLMATLKEKEKQKKLENKCEFCGAIFGMQWNLLVHKKSAKYCLKLRGETEVRYECECGRIFGYMASLQRHKKACNEKDNVTVIEELKSKLENTEKTLIRANAKIKSLKKEISDLKIKISNDEGKIEVYKERPGVVTNNNQYVNKLLQVKCDTIRPFTIETVREDVNNGKYTFDRFIQGEKGLIDFISDIISQDEQRSYVCTDSSRQRFHRLLESREWRDDNGATFLNKVLDELKEPTKEYYCRIVDMMVSGDKDTAEFLMQKTKPMAMGITCPKSKDRDATFTKIRNEVKKLATV